MRLLKQGHLFTPISFYSTSCEMPFFFFLVQILRLYGLCALYNFMRRKLSNLLALCVCVCVCVIFRRYLLHLLLKLLFTTSIIITFCEDESGNSLQFSFACCHCWSVLFHSLFLSLPLFSREIDERCPAVNVCDQFDK